MHAQCFRCIFIGLTKSREICYCAGLQTFYPLQQSLESSFSCSRSSSQSHPVLPSAIQRKHVKHTSIYCCYSDQKGYKYTQMVHFDTKTTTHINIIFAHYRVRTQGRISADNKWNAICFNISAIFERACACVFAYTNAIQIFLSLCLMWTRRVYICRWNKMRNTTNKTRINCVIFFVRFIQLSRQFMSHYVFSRCSWFSNFGFKFFACS